MTGLPFCLFALQKPSSNGISYIFPMHKLFFQLLFSSGCLVDPRNWGSYQQVEISVAVQVRSWIRLVSAFWQPFVDSSWPQKANPGPET